MNQETAQLLQQIGFEKSDLNWATQVVLILGILLMSYLITLIFSVVVNLAMYGKLKKLPMVESLKSVE